MTYEVATTENCFNDPGHERCAVQATYIIRRPGDGHKHDFIDFDIEDIPPYERF